MTEIGRLCAVRGVGLPIGLLDDSRPDTINLTEQTTSEIESNVRLGCTWQDTHTPALQTSTHPSPCTDLAIRRPPNGVDPESQPLSAGWRSITMNAHVVREARALAEQSDVPNWYESMFDAQFRSMKTLAAFLGADDPEDIASEAFVRLYERRNRLTDAGAALGYLRAIVVNLSRSRTRHLAVVRRHPAPDSEQRPSAEDSVIRSMGDADLAAALTQVSGRHREALVLRFWLGLSEKEMAAAMGVSAGTVKAHVSRGLAAVRTALIAIEEKS